MAYIGRDTDKISNVEVLDNITFDGSSSYTLQKGGSNFTPSSANNILISIDGVVQAGNFTVSSSTIDFGTAVAGTSTCDFILHYGVGLITTPSDGTVTTAKLADSSVSLAKLTATGTKDATTFLRGDNTFATPSDNVGIVNLGTSTISTGVSQIDIDFDYSTYKRMLIYWEGIQLVSDANMYMRAKISGSIDTGSNYTSGHVKKYYAGFDSNVYGGPNQAYWYVTDNIGADTNESWNSQMTIDLGSGTGMPTIHIACYYRSSAGNLDSNFGVLAYQNFSQIQGIRLYASTGNIDAGKYTVWGVK
jgi:hypothetical protein